jgi:4-diphosphocytidyl-2-C-methyl-D-erythritol kinase
MKTITIPAYAKINLMLNIVGKRPDGYHLLETVMQTTDLCDYITLEKNNHDIEIKVNKPELSTGKDNLAYKAAELFLKETGISAGIKINIEKNIPLSAGLAGGSSDAAGVLKGLNILYDTKLTIHRLAEIGAKLGADVPFCIVGGTVLAKGIGDKLEFLPSFPRLYLVLVKPDFGVSTAEVYRLYDEKNIGERNITSTLELFRNGKFTEALTKLQNSLEEVTCSNYHEVNEIKNKMLQLQAAASLMCGSGPTVFGILDNYNHAKKIADYFNKKYKEVYITKIN